MIRIGIAGWDYPDWEGIVYPSPPPKAFDRLVFLTGYFDAIEINASFYRQPEAAAAHSWAARSAARPDFRFTAKLYKGLTHAPGLSRPGTAENDAAVEAEAIRFAAGVEPLRAAGKLGAVLAQFPHSFQDRPAHRDHLRRLADLLKPLPIVAEFRHRSWDHEEALRFLHDCGLGFCNIDQPALGGTLRATGHVTSPVAYIRLHGRNAENWFRPGRDAAARYDYLYSEQELRPWIERAERLAERAEEVFIIANNHYRGKAPVNALMMTAALRRTRVRSPAGLVDLYAELKRVASPEGREPTQRDLFAAAGRSAPKARRPGRPRAGPRLGS